MSSPTRPVSGASTPVTPQPVHEVGKRPSLSSAFDSSSLTSMSHFQCCSGFFSGLRSCWERFKEWIGRCLGRTTLTPAVRENRFGKSSDAIIKSLKSELRHAAKQMSQEPQKPLQYSEGPFTTAIHTEEVQVGNRRVGIAHAQGRRPSMEDAHLATEFEVEIAGTKYPVQLFGIFDGHGGPEAAQYVRDHLRQEVHEALIENNPQKLSKAGVWKALKRACVRLNLSLKDNCPQMSFNQGTTATFALILNHKLWTANVGDSRTILDNHGSPVQLSSDAKPNVGRFHRGIKKRGGQVINVVDVPRVNGDLAVARSFGDNRLNGAISARPKITMRRLSKVAPGSNLLLCCDGVTDVASSRNLVHAAHAQRFAPPAVFAGNCVQSAYAAGSTDNLSLMVVKL
ncbi:MAG: PP2C family protein-serine/threonine phosphatase [Chlamydiota bacterium]